MSGSRARQVYIAGAAVMEALVVVPLLLAGVGLDGFVVFIAIFGGLPVALWLAWALSRAARGRHGAAVVSGVLLGLWHLLYLAGPAAASSDPNGGLIYFALPMYALIGLVIFIVVAEVLPAPKAPSA